MLANFSSLQVIREFQVTNLLIESQHHFLYLKNLIAMVFLGDTLTQLARCNNNPSQNRCKVANQTTVMKQFSKHKTGFGHCHGNEGTMLNRTRK